MEEIDRFQVPPVNGETQPLVRDGGWWWWWGKQKHAGCSYLWFTWMTENNIFYGARFRGFIAIDRRVRSDHLWIQRAAAQTVAVGMGVVWLKGDERRMDGGILLHFQVVVKPHDIKGSPCCITRLLATQLSRDDLCIWSISDFVSMAFALVYINASHPALRFATFRHVMTFHFGGSGGMHGTSRWMALNVSSVRSWTAADCNPDDGQARICPSYRYCVISRSPLPMIHDSHRPSSMGKQPCLYPLLFSSSLRHSTSLSISAEDTRSESS